MAGWWSCKDAETSNRSPWHMPYVPMVRSISSSRKMNTFDLIRIWHDSQGKDGSKFHVRTFSYDMYGQVVRFHLHKCLIWHLKKHKSMCNHPWKQNQKIISFLISPPLLGSHELNAKHYARSSCHIDLLTKKTVCHEHIHLLLTVHSTTNKWSNYEEVFFNLYSLGLWFVQRFVGPALQSLRFWSCNQLSVKSWRRARACARVYQLLLYWG